jgi:hypothetical protein
MAKATAVQPPNVPWQRDQRILRRLELVEAERLKGYSCLRVSQNLHMPYATCWEDFRRLDQLWLARVSQNQNALRADAVRRLDGHIRTAIALLERDEAYTQAVLFNLPVNVTCPGRQEHEIGRMLMADYPDREATAWGTVFTCTQPHIIQRKVHLDDKGSAQYRRAAGQILQSINAMQMNQARIMGIVVDKKALTDGEGKDLPHALAELLLGEDVVDVAALPSANEEDADMNVGLT